MSKRKTLVVEETTGVPDNFDAMVEGALDEEFEDSPAVAQASILTPEEEALVEEETTAQKPFLPEGAQGVMHPRADVMPPRGNFFENPGIVSDQNTTESMFGDKRDAELMRPRLSPDGRETMGFDKPHVRVDSLDPLTEALGTRFYRVSPIFDWCRKGMYNISPPGELDSRPRHTFTRWYFQVRVLVDIFESASPTVMREVAEKSEALYSQVTATEPTPIGYLPVVRGAFVSPGIIASALRGSVLPLQEKRTSYGVGQ